MSAINQQIRIKIIWLVFWSMVTVSSGHAYETHELVNVSGQWDGGTHYISDVVTVQKNETLTIQPGTVIKFAPGKNIKIYGRLSVKGTSAEPVVFTSRDDNSVGENIAESDGTPYPGDWTGIHMDGTEDKEGIGEFDQCIVRYGGSFTIGVGSSANVNFVYSDSGYFINSTSEYSKGEGIRIHGCSPLVKESAVAYNGTYGLYAHWGHDPYFTEPVITDNSFTGNGQYAAYLNSAILTSYSGNTGSENGINGFVVSGYVRSDQTWTMGADTFPFILTGAVTVEDGARLTLPAGTVVKAKPDAGCKIDVYGTLDVNGTLDQPVVFTSLKDDTFAGDTKDDGDNSRPLPGDWGGVCVYGSDDNDGIGEFDWCRIRYGGGSDGANVFFDRCNSAYFKNSVSEFSSEAGIRIHGCSPAISKNTISDNITYGIWSHWANNEETAPVIIDNSFVNNGQYAAYLDNCSLTSYSGNSGSGNGINGFALNGTVRSDQIRSDQTWTMGSEIFPFILTGSVTVEDGARLTLSAGTVVKAESDVITKIDIYGSLDVDGTDTRPVVFTSLKDDSFAGDTNNDGENSEPLPGDWCGLSVYGYGDNDGIGEFDWCRIRYGGSTDYANVFFDRCNMASFANSISEYSIHYGIRINNSSVKIRGSRIVNNSGAGIYIAGTTVIPDLGTTDDGGNNILNGNNQHNVYNQSDLLITAERNYWGYTTFDEIGERIYNHSGKSIVDFDPWLGADNSMICGPVTLEKAVQMLKIMAGITISAYNTPCLDTVKDEKVSISDIIFSLQMLAALREQ